MRIRRCVVALGVVLLLTGCDVLSGDASEDDQGGYEGKDLGAVSEPRQGPVRPGAGTASAEPRSGDFNGDGYDDLAAEADGHVVVVYGSPRGLDPRVRTSARVSAAVDPEELDSPSYPADVITFDRGDLDHDGFTDLLATRRDGEQYAMWGGPRGLAGKRRLDTGVRTVNDLESAGWETGAVVDFDGDGTADVFRLGPANGSEGTIHFGPFGRDGGPDRTQTLDGKEPMDSAPYRAVAGDFDGDGYDDLTVWLRWTDPDSEGDGITYPRGVQHFRGGERSAVFAGTLDGESVPEGPSADLDGDGTDDLYEPRFEQHNASLTLDHVLSTKSGPATGRSGNTKFSELPRLAKGADGQGTYELAEVPDASAGGDVTGDGRPDLVISAGTANADQGSVYLVTDVAHADGTGSVQAVDLQSPGVPGTSRKHSRDLFSARPPLLDVDGDGHLDLVAATGHGSKLKGFCILPGTASGLDTRATRHLSYKDLGLGG